MMMNNIFSWGTGANGPKQKKTATLSNDGDNRKKRKNQASSVSSKSINSDIANLCCSSKNVNEEEKIDNEEDNRDATSDTCNKDGSDDDLSSRRISVSQLLLCK